MSITKHEHIQKHKQLNKHLCATNALYDLKSDTKSLPLCWTGFAALNYKSFNYQASSVTTSVLGATWSSQQVSRSCETMSMISKKLGGYP